MKVSWIGAVAAGGFRVGLRPPGMTTENEEGPPGSSPSLTSFRTIAPPRDRSGTHRATGTAP